MSCGRYYPQKKENNVWLNSDRKWKLLTYLPGKVKERAPDGIFPGALQALWKDRFPGWRLAPGTRYHLDGFGKSAFHGQIFLAGHRPNCISIGLTIFKTEILILGTGQDL